MKQSMVLTVAGVVLTILAACGAAGSLRRAQTDVPFTVAHHYYYKSYTEAPANPMVTTRAEFDKRYGEAAVMGKNGQPTDIDFGRQLAIGVVLPLTNDHVEVRPTRLTADGDTLVLYYQVETLERNMSSTMRPMALVVVDRDHKRGYCRLQRE